MVPEKPSPGYGTINQKFVGEPSSHSCGLALLILLLLSSFRDSHPSVLAVLPWRVLDLEWKGCGD